MGKIKNRSWGCILQLLLVTAAFAFGIVEISAAPLSAENEQILREAAQARIVRDQGQQEFQSKISLGQELAGKLGRANNPDAIPLLLELRDDNLLIPFGNDFQGPTTPEIANLIVQYRLDPIIGLQAVRLTKRNSSRPLFDALLSDLKPSQSRIREYDKEYYITALLQTELPGVEGEVVELLQDPVLMLRVSKFLMARKYWPAESVLFDCLDKMAVSDRRLGELALIAVSFNTQRMHDTAARKLIELSRAPGNYIKDHNFVRLLQSLTYGVPAIKLNPQILDETNFLGFSEKQRVDIASTIKHRADREKLATEITAKNFIYWISANEEQMVELFIAKHVNVNAMTDRGRPLDIAVSHLQWPLVRRLLAAGTDPRLADSTGNTPMHRLAGPSPLVATPAWRQERANFVRAFAMAGADVSAPNQDGVTPLHAAVSSSNVEVAEVLLESGANINAECIDPVLRVKGLTPLQLAIDTNNQPLEVLLRSKGGRVNRTLQARRMLDVAKRAAGGIILNALYK